MFTDRARCGFLETLHSKSIEAFRPMLTPEVFAEAARRAGLAIVRSPLNLVTMVYLGIAVAINVGTDFATILGEVMGLYANQREFAKSNLGAKGQKAKKHGKKSSKHSPHRRQGTVVSESAFCQARLRMPLSFWHSLIMVLGEAFLSQHPETVRFGDFRILAMDGSDIDLPNWKALSEAFGHAKNQTGLHNVQARMVMLQFPFTRMPYRYELCPLKEGEPTIARRLVPHLQAKDMVLLDAGFWSYGLFHAIAKQGAFLAIRRRMNQKTNLTTIQRLGRNDVLLRWTPTDPRRRWRNEGWPPSITLRGITYKIKGFRHQQIITTHLDPQQISYADWTRLASKGDPQKKMFTGLFHRRWEIETTFRELKVEQQMEKALRCRTPAGIQFEVASHVVYYLLTRWQIVEAAKKHGHTDPLRLSFLSAQREFREKKHSLMKGTRQECILLRDTLLDEIARHVVPYRPGRHEKRKKRSSGYRRRAEARQREEAERQKENAGQKVKRTKKTAMQA